MTTNKHAYLIMAHERSYVLEKTLNLIDDVRNDIYIHFDARMGDTENYQQEIKNNMKFSNIFFIHRRKVFWGDFSMSAVTIDLLETAISRGGVQLSAFVKWCRYADKISRYYS